MAHAEHQHGTDRHFQQVRSEAQLTELVSNPDARRVVIDKELVETAKLFKGAEFDRRTLLDFDATPTASSSDEDGPQSASPTPRGD